MRTKKIPEDTGERVAVCVIFVEGTSLSAMSPQEQFTQRLVNGVNSVIPNVEIDKSTAVEDDLKLEIPLPGQK